MRPETSLRWAAAAAVLLLGLFFLVPTLFYVVDQREMAVVLQFGNPVAERTEPGIYFKIPFIQEVRRLPSTRQFWGDNPAVALPDLPTIDDKKIEVIPWAIWRVKEPTIFVQRLRTMDNAEELVAQFVRGTIRDTVTKYDLAELVRSSDRTLHTSSGSLDIEADQVGPEPAVPRTRQVKMDIRHGRPKILKEIKDEVSHRLAAGAGNGTGLRGLELIDVGVSQIEFVESVRRKTFDRWIAERQAISARNINEGERMKQAILNRAAADVERIEGDGQRQANEIRGKVDAEIIRKYAQAIEEAGDFYTFVRTLEAYKNAIGSDTRLILTTDSEFLRLLKRFEAAPASTSVPGNKATKE
ncbi:MAG: protease modulator HflC [Gemmataceae bacterium]|nr:protease modulator HflC [Gemmataceae bacterium]